MEDLKTAFEWTVKNTATPDADKWKYYYGTWLAGRGDTSQAIDILTQTSFEMAKPLLARLLRLKGDNKAAAAAYRSINERWLQLHPQVVIERDKVLRSLGSSTIKEREDWLLQVNALPDEWLIERRVQLLIDKGEPEKAKELLLSVPFQKVHQTYSRTNMWFQICDMLKESHYPIPEQLGEDRLATFGAYREFE
jgi:hypothetical protein